MTSRKDLRSNIISTRDHDLKRKIENLATQEKRTLSQMARILLKEAVSDREKVLGLRH